MLDGCLVDPWWIFGGSFVMKSGVVFFMCCFSMLCYFFFLLCGLSNCTAARSKLALGGFSNSKAAKGKTGT
jgi:hypothetical protein